MGWKYCVFCYFNYRNAPRNHRCVVLGNHDLNTPLLTPHGHHVSDVVHRVVLVISHYNRIVKNHRILRVCIHTVTSHRTHRLTTQTLADLTIVTLLRTAALRMRMRPFRLRICTVKVTGSVEVYQAVYGTTWHMFKSYVIIFSTGWIININRGRRRRV